MKKLLTLIALIPFIGFSQTDLAVGSVITSPDDGCSLGTEDVTIVIVNVAATPFSGSIDCGYHLNGGSPVIESTTITLPGSSTYIYTFTAQVDASACQEHELTFWVYNASDIDNSNDTLSYQFISDCPPQIGVFSPDTTCINAPDSACHNGYVGNIVDWSVSVDGMVTWTSTGDTTDCLATLGLATDAHVMVHIDSPFGLCPSDSAHIAVNCNLTLPHTEYVDINVPTVIYPNQPWVIQGIMDHPGNRVLVYDHKGRLLYSKVNYNNDWTAEEIPAGMYLYEIQLQEQRLSGKLVIQH